MDEIDCLRVCCNKDVVVKVSDKTAVNHRLGISFLGPLFSLQKKQFRCLLEFRHVC